jgi:hypothetical protein
MRIGGSLVLIALGAILKFAITTNNTHGVNIGTIGVILMIVGLVGLVITLIWMSTRRRTDIIEHGPGGPVRGRTYMTTPSDYDAPL